MLLGTAACIAAVLGVEPYAQVVRSTLCLQERLEPIERMVLGWFVALGFILCLF